MRIVIPTCFLALLFLHPVKAQDVASFGGEVTCQTFTTASASAKEGGAWVFGFWTGLNVMAALQHEAHDIGHTLQPQQVISAVLNICQQRPTMNLAVAAAIAWKQAKAENR